MHEFSSTAVFYTRSHTQSHTWYNRTSAVTLTTSSVFSPLPSPPLPSPHPSLVGFPGAFNRIGSVRLDECPTYGCFLELTIQLVIILLGKQILNNFMELGLPIGKQLWKRFRHKKGDDAAVYTRWERDYDLPDDDKFGLLPEYLELVIQYGFITIFVAAFPLAPLAALLNNWVEIRLDAYKYVVFVRRQVAERAQDIGAWYGILEVISKLAVVTNVRGWGWGWGVQYTLPGLCGWVVL